MTTDTLTTEGVVTDRAAVERQRMDLLNDSRGATRRALNTGADEICRSIYRADASGTTMVIFERRYGVDQGIRTVVLDKDLNLVANAFAPGQRSTGTGRGVVGQAILAPTTTPKFSNRYDDILGVPVHPANARPAAGWYLDFDKHSTKLSVGPFENLAAMDDWLEMRASWTGRPVGLESGERIHKVR